MNLDLEERGGKGRGNRARKITPSASERSRASANSEKKKERKDSRLSEIARGPWHTSAGVVGAGENKEKCRSGRLENKA